MRGFCPRGPRVLASPRTKWHRFCPWAIMCRSQAARAATGSLPEVAPDLRRQARLLQVPRGPRHQARLLQEPFGVCVPACLLDIAHGPRPLREDHGRSAARRSRRIGSTRLRSAGARQQPGLVLFEVLPQPLLQRLDQHRGGAMFPRDHAGGAPWAAWRIGDHQKRYLVQQRRAFVRLGRCPALAPCRRVGGGQPPELRRAVAAQNFIGVLAIRGRESRPATGGLRLAARGARVVLVLPAMVRVLLKLGSRSGPVRCATTGRAASCRRPLSAGAAHVFRGLWGLWATVERPPHARSGGISGFAGLLGSHHPASPRRPPRLTAASPQHHAAHASMSGMRRSNRSDRR